MHKRKSNHVNVEEFMKNNRKKDQAFNDLGGVDINILDNPDDYFVGNVCKYINVAQI